MRSRNRLRWPAALDAFALCAQAHAQPAINTNVALQPRAGGLIFRQQFRYAEGDAPHPTQPGADFERFTSSSTLVYGVSPELAIISTLSVASRWLDGALSSDSHHSAIQDIPLLAKVRLLRDDFGPTSTSRLALLTGLEIPAGDKTFGSDSLDPILGAVYTLTDGRDTLSLDALWKFNTGGDADQLTYDAAYSRRLWPETYGADPDNPRALFAVAEINGKWATDGRDELFLSPGIQFVTRDWIVEATVQLPVGQDLPGRDESDFVVGIGFRLQF